MVEHPPILSPLVSEAPSGIGIEEPTSVRSRSGLHDVTFAFREGTFMRLLSEGYERAVPTDHVSRKVVPSDVPLSVCYDAGELKQILGPFEPGVVVSDQTLFRALTQQLQQPPVRAYSALPHYEKANPIEALVDQVAEVATEIRERGFTPVVIEQNLGDHLYTAGFDPRKLPAAVTDAVAPLVARYRDPEFRKAFAYFIAAAGVYANEIASRLELPIVRLGQFSIPYDATSEVTGSMRNALLELRAPSDSTALLMDHHLLEYFARQPHDEVCKTPIVLICPCCIGARGMDIKRRGVELLPLPRTLEWRKTIDNLTGLVERARAGASPAA